MHIFVYSSQNDVGVIYNPPDLGLMGKTIKMKFSIKVGVEKWYKGTEPSYDERSGKYGVYFLMTSTILLRVAFNSDEIRPVIDMTEVVLYKTVFCYYYYYYYY